MIGKCLAVRDDAKLYSRGKMLTLHNLEGFGCILILNAKYETYKCMYFQKSNSLKWKRSKNTGIQTAFWNIKIHVLVGGDLIAHRPGQSVSSGVAGTGAQCSWVSRLFWVSPFPWTWINTEACRVSSHQIMGVLGYFGLLKRNDRTVGKGT